MYVLYDSTEHNISYESEIYLQSLDVWTSLDRALGEKATHSLYVQPAPRGASCPSGDFTGTRSPLLA